MEVLEIGVLPHVPTVRDGLRRGKHRHDGEAPPFRILVANLYLVGLLGRVFETFDKALYRDLSEVNVEQPIVIAAPPRSGTTLLHRLMACDPRFATPQLIETILPARSAKRLLSTSKPPFSLLVPLINKFFAGYDQLHETRIDKAEEDVFLWLRGMAGPTICFAFPYLQDLGHRLFPDDFEEPERSKLGDAYIRGLTPLLHANPAASTLLIKNTFAAGTLDIMRERFPDLRVINIVRHPFDTLPSAVRLLHNAVQQRSGRPLDPSRPEWQAVADVVIEYYRRLEAFEPTFGDRWINVRFTDLVAAPTQTVAEIYDQWAIPLPDDVRDRITSLSHHPGFRSSGQRLHLADIGLTPTHVAAELGQIFDRWGFDPNRPG